MASNVDANVALTFTTRDQASPGIQRLGGNLTRLQANAAGVGKAFTQNSTAFIGAGLALATAGAQVAQLGVKFGLFDEETGKTLGTVLQVTGVFFTMAGAIGQTIAVVAGFGIGIGGITAAFISFLPIALTVLAVLTAIAAIVTLGQILGDPTAPTTFEKVTGIDVLRTKQPAGTRSRQLAPGEVGFGEDFFGAAGGVARDIGRQARSVFLGQTGGQPRIGEGGAGGVTINAGTIIADEGGMRDLEKRFRQIRKEDERTRGISK